MQRPELTERIACDINRSLEAGDAANPEVFSALAAQTVDSLLRELLSGKDVAVIAAESCESSDQSDRDRENDEKENEQFQTSPLKTSSKEQQAESVVNVRIYCLVQIGGQETNGCSHSSTSLLSQGTVWTWMTFSRKSMRRSKQQQPRNGIADECGISDERSCMIVHAVLYLRSIYK